MNVGQQDQVPGPLYLRTENARFQGALVGVLVAIAVVSFALGFIPLYEVGRWAELPVAVAALLPIALDLGAVVSALAALVRRARGQKASFEVVLLALLAVASVAAQVTHAYELAGGWNARSILVAGLLGLAPILTLASSHIALRALMPPPARGKKTRAARASAPAQTPSSKTVEKPTAAAAANPVLVAAPGELPSRVAGEDDLDYAVRLVDAGVSQRRAAELGGVSRSRVETRLKQRKAA